jgi:hypothetical protein
MFAVMLSKRRPVTITVALGGPSRITPQPDFDEAVFHFGSGFLASTERKVSQKTQRGIVVA